MSYKFNPMDYTPDVCAGCGGMSGLEMARIMVAGESREVPAVYLCDRCAAHGTPAGVTPIRAFVWLTGTLIPKALLASGQFGDDQGPMGGLISSMILAEADAANALASDLARELAGVDPEPEPFSSFNGSPMAPGGAELAAMLDLRREADGTVTYACPNPSCPDGNRHPLSFAADVMPVELVDALIGHLPE